MLRTYIRTYVRSRVIYLTRACKHAISVRGTLRIPVRTYANKRRKGMAEDEAAADAAVHSER